jgi:hypothetical protein
MNDLVLSAVVEQLDETKASVEVPQVSISPNQHAMLSPLNRKQKRLRTLITVVCGTEVVAKRVAASHEYHYLMAASHYYTST